MGSALARGEAVVIPIATQAEVPTLQSFVRARGSGTVFNFSAETVVVNVDEHIQDHLQSAIANTAVNQNWSKEDLLKIGIGSGAICCGAAAAYRAIADQIAPGSAVALTIAATLFGSGLGAAVAAGLISNMKFTGTGIELSSKLARS
jgi:hypothetical protein